jgi:CheY-like chemotaxis protein
MKSTVLVADDSQIIQKVIKIALATESFELMEAIDEAQLLDKNAQERPALVLLDFNLSSSQTGYELAKIIKKNNSSVKILMMYATFDPIDENALKDAGVEAHITKPFDGNKLIQICRNLSEGGVVIPQKIVEKIEAKPVAKELPKVIEPTLVSQALDVGSDWEINVPDIIGGNIKNEMMDLPPVISAQAQAQPQTIDPHSVGEISLEINPIQIEVQKSDFSVPSEDDLEYPDLNLSSTNTHELDLQIKPNANLISLDDLVSTNNSGVSNEIDFGNIIQSGTTTKEEVKNIEDQINDEKSDDLWAADEFETVESISKDVIQDVLDIGAVEPEEDFKPMDLSKLQTYQEEDIPQIQPHKLEAIQGGFSEEKSEKHDDFIFREESIHDNKNKINSDEMAEQILAKLIPQVENMVRNYCKDTVEKVAWEAIPEIAEKLIKKEIQKISDSIIK